MAAPLTADRVLETSTTTGTGTYTLAGAVTGFQSFAAIGNGNTCYYYAEDVDSNGIPTGSWEAGIATYTLSGTTLARTTIIASSNSNAAVSWSAGTRRISNGPLARSAAIIGCRVFNSASISIPGAGQLTPLTFDSEEYDNGACHSTGSNTGRLTAPVGGLYDLWGCVQMAASVLGGRQLYIRVNGTTYPAQLIQAPASTGNPWSTTISVQGYYMAATDYAELVVAQDSGGALNIVNALNASPYFGMALRNPY